MVAEMVQKPLTEAQRLMDRLVDEFAMPPQEIARLTKIKIDAIHDIKRRKTTGNLQLRYLRRLVSSLETGGNPLETPGISLPDVSDPPPVVSFPDDPAALTLNADEPAPAEKKPITERATDWLRAAMLGDTPFTPSTSSSMTAPSGSSKRKAKGDGEQGELIEQLVPLAALFLVVSGSVLLPDPYKPCGPNQVEASAIAYPIVKRAVRELDARQRLSESTTDAIAILLAISAYGVRAHGTYQQIHAMEVERVRSDGSSGGPERTAAAFVVASGGGNGGSSSDAAGAARDARAGGSLENANGPVPFGRRAGHDGEAARGAGRGASGGAVEPQQRQPDPSIADLLQQDALGRKRLGL